MPETPEQRSRTMRAVKAADTEPELAVRRIAHALGFRFRLHRGDLPGTPDLVFPRLHKIIFVHGCFWHGHACDRGARIPKNNRDYWIRKVDRNRTRDKTVRAELRRMGWKAAVVWECELKQPEKLTSRIRKFLER